MFYENHNTCLDNRNKTSLTFQKCLQVCNNTSTSITSITIPESVNTIESEIGPFAFCSKLTEIRINKPKDSIKGAPWAYGTTGINVIWKE